MIGCTLSVSGGILETVFFSSVLIMPLILTVSISRVVRWPNFVSSVIICDVRVGVALFTMVTVVIVESLTCFT